MKMEFVSVKNSKMQAQAARRPQRHAVGREVLVETQPFHVSERFYIRGLRGGRGLRSAGRSGEGRAADQL